MAPPTCPRCGNTNMFYDIGTSVCDRCGTVVEENAIVAEVTFGESSNGAAIAHGKNVPAGGNGIEGVETRPQAISNGKMRIREIAASMKLGPYIEERAQRWFQVCVTSNFIKGRSSLRVAAACLYISCRLAQSSHMLIDFSDKLRISVFELGATYTKLVRVAAQTEKLPLIDPAHYIGRFAALLEFGSETEKVATDAARLVKRFDQDWLRIGRRPSGICGACLLLAARMNNFRRSVEEIVQVVKIADCTIKKRLEEFKNTPSGNLTVEQFREIWLSQSNDPPAFTRGKEKRLREEAEGMVGVEEEETGGEKERALFGDDEDAEGDADDEEDDGEDSRPRKRRRTSASTSPTRARPSSSPTRHRQSATPMEDVDKVAGAAGPQPDDDVVIGVFNGLSGEIDHAAYQEIAHEVEKHVQEGEAILHLDASSSGRTLVDSGDGEGEGDLSTAVQPDVDIETDADHEPGDTTDVPALTDGEDDETRASQTPAPEVDLLDDIDDDEIERYICTPDEVTRKTRVWVEFNLQYLENLAAKQLDAETGVEKVKKKRSKPAKPKDSSNPMGASAADATRKALEKKSTSRRINYDVYTSLLTSDISGLKKSKKSKAEKRKRDHHKSRRSEEDEDGNPLSGLEAMSDGSHSDWSNGPNARNVGGASDTFDEPHGGDDGGGYDSDDYQQEA